MSRSLYRVIYGDTDQMGVVYYANYLRLFERGRCEYMLGKDFNYASVEEAGYMLPVIDARCQYKRPALYGDELIIDTEISASTGVRITFDYRILREESGDETLLALGSTVHACMTREGRPVRIPPVVAKLLQGTPHV